MLKLRFIRFFYVSTFSIKHTKDFQSKFLVSQLPSLNLAPNLISTSTIRLLQHSAITDNENKKTANGSFPDSLFYQVLEETWNIVINYLHISTYLMYVFIIIIIFISRKMSAAEHRHVICWTQAPQYPLYDILPATTLIMTSIHLARGLPIFRLPIRGPHSKT